MEFVNRVTKEALDELIVREQYLEGTKMILNSLKLNLERAEKIHGSCPSLRAIYTNISFLGIDNNLSPATEKNILSLVRNSERLFAKELSQLPDTPEN